MPPKKKPIPLHDVQGLETCISNDCTNAAMARYYGVARSTIALRIKEINEGLKVEESKDNKLPIGQHSRESVESLFKQWFNGRMGDTEVFTVRLDPSQNEIRFAGKRKGIK